VYAHDEGSERVTPHAVSKWRARFVEQRLDKLLDAPRPGAPRSIDDARVNAVIVNTLESVPAGAAHRSTRTTVRKMDLSQTAVSRIWGAFGLQPHTASNPSSSPATRCSSRRCATSTHS